MSSTQSLPLVSVGIPTYNRASSLQRAVKSVLEQDYPNLEIVISDNASTDSTQDICRDLADQDKRIHYIRQSTNRGPTANFNEVFMASQGEFFMWLGDDDWLDSNYVGRCTNFLLGQPEYALVCGKANYYQGEEFAYEGVKVNLLQSLGCNRTLAYYNQVQDNGTFYGVMRRDHLLKVPMQNVLGNDWLIISAITLKGKIKTLEDTHINRLLGGSSKSIINVASTLELPEFQARVPYLIIALNIFKDLNFNKQAYMPLNKFSRFMVGCISFSIVFTRFYLFIWYYSFLSRTSVLRQKIKLRTRLKKALHII